MTHLAVVSITGFYILSEETELCSKNEMIINDEIYHEYLSDKIIIMTFKEIGD